MEKVVDLRPRASGTDGLQGRRQGMLAHSRRSPRRRDGVVSFPNIAEYRLEPDRRDVLRRISRLVNFLDQSFTIPGTQVRVGFDSIIGLIPAVGDVLSQLISGYIILLAAQLGIPFVTLVRMVGNLVVDTAVGSIPVLGDIFDVAYKANVRNLRLIERHIGRGELVSREPGVARRLVSWAVVTLIGLSIGAAVMSVGLVVYLLGQLF